MSKHNRSRGPRSSAKLSRTLAMSAIAGCTVGLGVLASAATAQADDCVDSDLACGWFSDFLSDNNLQLGMNGNGNTNQIGIANGNIANGQLNIPILSPVIAGGNAVNAAPTLGGLAIGGAGTSVAADVDVPVAGAAVGINPAIAGLGVGGSNLGAALGGLALGGWGVGAGLPVSTGGVAAPVNAGLQTGVGGLGPGTGSQTVGGGETTAGGGSSTANINATGAGAEGGDAENDQEAGDGEGGDASSNQNITRGGNATSSGSATSGTANGGAASGGSASSGANANAGGNQSNNTSSNNTSSNNGNNSSSSNG